MLMMPLQGDMLHRGFKHSVMKLVSRKPGLSPQYFNTDRSKAIIPLWFLTVTVSCCLYLYFGSAIMLVTCFVNFRLLNDHLFGKELFIRFTASAFRKLPSIYVFSYFPFGFEGRMWDLIVSVPDHCLSFYFSFQGTGDNKRKLDVLQNFFGVENNQVLLMKYELMGLDIEFYSFNRSTTGRIVDAIFEKSSREVVSYETVTTTTTYSGDYLVNFVTFKGNFMSHLFEEPVDTATW